MLANAVNAAYANQVKGLGIMRKHMLESTWREIMLEDA